MIVINMNQTKPKLNLKPWLHAKIFSLVMLRTFSRGFKVVNVFSDNQKYLIPSMIELTINIEQSYKDIYKKTVFKKSKKITEKGSSFSSFLIAHY